MKRDQDIRQWHRWFAWRPVQVQDGCATRRWVWLRTLSRRRVPETVFCRACWIYSRGRPPA
jgi:hypothetical protein